MRDHECASRRRRRRCCCCFDLQTGVALIGAGQLVQSTLLCALFMAFWLLGRDYKDLPLQIFFATKGIQNALDAVCDIVLVVGATTRERRLLTPWMVSCGAGLGLGVLSWLAAPAVMLGHALLLVPAAPTDAIAEMERGHRRLAAVCACALLVVGAVQTALSVYFLLAVRDLRLQFLQQRLLRQPAETPASTPKPIQKRPPTPIEEKIEEIE